MTAAPQTAAAPAVLVPLASAIAAGALYVACFYPGTMSPDSTYAWWMARGGETNDVQGVGLVWLWRLTEPWLSGPAGPFVCMQALFWLGVALIALALPPRPLLRGACVLLAGVAPVCFVLLSHVWSDVGLMVALAAATGALLRYRARPRLHWMFVASGLLWWALILRHNALPAVLPLLGYAVYLWTSEHGSVSASRRRLAVGTSIAAVAFWLTSSAANHWVDHRVNILPSLALWDLIAVSAKSGEVLLPEDTHGPDLDVAELRKAYRAYANVPTFLDLHSGLMAPFLDAGDSRSAEVRSAWLDAIHHHPGAYLSHRWQVTKALFGTHRREWPLELVYASGEAEFAGNPPVAANTTAAHALLMRAFDAARPTIALAAWPYVVLAFVAALVAWRRREQANARAALVVLASGLLYAAPLPFIAPAAELRYLGWTCLAALLGAALAFTAPRQPVDQRVTASRAYPPAP